MTIVKILVSLLVVQGYMHAVFGAIGGKPPKGLEGTSYVLLFADAEEACSGTLIDRRWVLTTAYCVEYKAWSVYSAVINGQTIVVDRTVFHPMHNGSFVNNMALLRLERPAMVGDPMTNVVDGLLTVDMEEKIKKKHRRCYYFSTGMIRGDDGIYKVNKRITKVGVRFMKRCKNTFAGLNGSNHLSCIKGTSRDTTTCLDGGAAIMCRHQGLWYPTGILGLIDYRNQCHSSEVVSLNVALHSAWIRSVIDA